MYVCLGFGQEVNNVRLSILELAFIHFGAKLILILYDSFVFLGVFFLYFPPLTSFLLSSLETPTQNQFFAILILTFQNFRTQFP